MLFHLIMVPQFASYYVLIFLCLLSEVLKMSSSDSQIVLIKNLAEKGVIDIRCRDVLSLMHAYVTCTFSVAEPKLFFPGSVFAVNFGSDSGSCICKFSRKKCRFKQNTVNIRYRVPVNLRKIKNYLSGKVIFQFKIYRYLYVYF